MAISITVKDTPVHVGDLVRLHLKVIEGEKERLQVYEGMVIGIRGRGEDRTMTVRKISAANIGVERIIPVHSPWLAKVEVKKPGRVRRAKLNFIRTKSARQVAQVTQNQSS